MDLDWYSTPKRPKSSDLFKLATHRARLASFKGEDVVEEFIPSKITRGGNRTWDSLDTYKFILDHTRHTPRDFLQVLHYIQLQTRRNRVTSDRVFDGLREYSMKYFLPEVNDELSGYFDPDSIHKILQVIGGLRRRDFTLQDLLEYAKTHHKGKDLDWWEVLRVLFDCSVLGNLVQRPGSGKFFTFRFRNQAATANFEESFVVHRGIWKALNLT